MTTETTTSYLPSGMPLPEPSPDGLDTEFWEAAHRHELIVQRCNACQTFQFGPEWLCHACRSFDMGWHRVSGQGRIYSWERSWYPVHPALQSKLPYLVVLVELPDAGNVRMVGNLLGNPEQPVEIGAVVEAVFEDHPLEQISLVQWRLVDHHR